MLCIIRDKFIRLARGEDGVAFVTTLAVFMFVYLVCMGVYAIGTAVKTRIHLQNACDAAAYSAAVVQADTLSRIATINRAMSWTYVQMCRRQMDYIVWKWIDHSISHFDKDKETAKKWYSNPGYHGDHGMSDIVLNGHFDIFKYPREELARLIEFSSIGHFNGPSVLMRRSFYAHDGLTSITPGDLRDQIVSDKATIKAMNDAQSDLANDLHDNVQTAVRDVLYANTSGVCDISKEKIKVEQSDSPLDDYLRRLDCNSDDEGRFVSWSDGAHVPSTASEDSASYVKSRISEKGLDLWFCRADIQDGKGIQRRYRVDVPSRPLYATWSWWSWRCKCDDGLHEDKEWRAKEESECEHKFMRCWCESNDKFDRMRFKDGTAKTGSVSDKNYSSISYADTLNEIRETIGVGELAAPIALKSEFFGKAGTITVVVASENINAWLSVLGDACGGIFSAFNPFAKYTVCIASAKAGFKYVNEDAENATRAYRVSWEDVGWSDEGQSWNLCQSDWDAVLIPVRRAESLAVGKGGLDAQWKDDVGEFLDGYLNGIASSDDMKAGGDGIDVAGFYAGRDLGEEYRFGNRSGFWGGAELSTLQDDTGKVNAKWQIGNPNAAINWNGLQKVMFH